MAKAKVRSEADGVLWRPSPNFGKRPKDAIISLIVLHADESRSLGGTLSWLMAPKSQVSYHTVISRNGAVYELVEWMNRAWHAGVSSWGGVPDCNDYSIGVCMGANPQNGKTPFTETQLDRTARYAVELMRTFPAITLSRIVMHSQIALPPGRRRDPYPAEPTFDLQAFRERVKRHLNNGEA